MSNEGLSLLKKYEQDYWQTIATGIQFLPAGYLHNFLAAIKQIVINDCTDGYLILRFAEREGAELIVTYESSLSWKDLLHEQKLYDSNEIETTQRLTLQMKDPSKFTGHMFTMASVEIRKDGSVVHPKWLSATIVVGEPGKDFDNPTDDAKRDIKTLITANNLGVRINTSFNITSDRVIKRLENLLAQYRQCLLEAKVEEDIQRFIEQNPFVLNPWGKIFPKYKLGTKFVCDFLVEDLIAPDFKHIFVELEPASTVLFRKNSNEKEQREFRSRLNHGISQLRDWEIWITENSQALKADFPEFYQPSFILVIGRNEKLSEAQKKVILNENARSKSRTILTYDDLARRLEELIKGLRKISV